MTREEAQAELDACTLRPGDASSGALAFAAQDPALAAWLAERTAFDEAVAAALPAATTATPPAPQVLSALVLAMQQASAEPAPVPAASGKEATAPAPATAAHPGPHARPRLRGAWARATWLAAAAVLTLAGLAWWWQADTSWQGEAVRLVALVDHGMARVDHKGPSLEEHKAHLAAASAPVPGAMPAGIRSMRCLACKVVKVQGRPASIVCFLISPQKEAHLVVMDSPGPGAAAPASAPLFAEVRGWHTAQWTADGKVYLLATQAEPALLRQLFAVAATGTPPSGPGIRQETHTHPPTRPTHLLAAASQARPRPWAAARAPAFLSGPNARRHLRET